MLLIFRLNAIPTFSGRADDFFCAALKCGFLWGWEEGGSQPHFHIQRTPGCNVPKLRGDACKCK